MTWHQHAVVIFFVRFAKAHTLTINKVIFGTSAVTLKIGNTSIIETMGILFTIYVPPHVPFFYWLGGAMHGSYLSTGSVRLDPWVCSSGGEPFDLYPPPTSLPTSPLMAPEPLFHGVAMSDSTKI